MTKLNLNKLFFQTVAMSIVCLAVLSIVSCECPYLEERNSQYSSSKGDHLTADLLTGLWQCYYPMYISSRSPVTSGPNSISATLAASTHGPGVDLKNASPNNHLYI